MQKFMQYALALGAAILMTFPLVAQQAPSISFLDLVETAEADFSVELVAKQRAMALELPVNIYLPGEAFIEVKGIENDQPVYSVVTNFARYFDGSSVAFYEAIEANFDLSNARINYGDGNIVDPNPTAGRTPMPVSALGVLLIPESSNDRIMAFDRETGALINADFIPDDGNLSTPIMAAPDLTKSGPIHIADQIDDVVYAYDDQTGNFIGVFAPAGGADNSILDNLRGFDFREGTTGNLLQTVASGANADAIAEFDDAGNYLGNFIANGAGGVDGPYDVTWIDSKGSYLVSASTSDAIAEFDMNGNYLGDFVPVVNGFPNFTEQVAETVSGNVLFAQFSGGAESGTYEYTPGGTQVNSTNAVQGARGVYQLGNGNLLVTNGSGVFEVNPLTNTVVEDEITGVSARFIAEYNFQPIVPGGGGGGGGMAIPTMGEWALFLFALFMITLGSVYVYNTQRQLAVAGAMNVPASSSRFSLPFDAATFRAVLPTAGVTMAIGFVLILIGWGEIVALDIIGMAIAGPIVAYLLHLRKLSSEA